MATDSTRVSSWPDIWVTFSVFEVNITCLYAVKVLVVYMHVFIFSRQLSYHIKKTDLPLDMGLLKQVLTLCVCVFL